jgi:hypothetical protein
MKSKTSRFIATIAAVQASEIAVTIDGASPGRVFEGVGALSAGASSRLLIEYPEPKVESRPGCYWWRMGSAVDKENITWNLETMREAGTAAQGRDGGDVPERTMEALRAVISEGIASKSPRIVIPPGLYRGGTPRFRQLVIPRPLR